MCPESPRARNIAAVQRSLPAPAGDPPADPSARALLVLARFDRGPFPQAVLQFFAPVNRRMRWELNDQARRSDEEPGAVERNAGLVPAHAGGDRPRAGG